MKEKVVYKFDEFVDFKGLTHKITVAAVSRVLDSPIKLSEKEFLPKVLCIGFAIQNPEDEYNEEIGKSTAYRKALSRKNPFKMYVSFPGMINTKVVDAMIDQEILYFKNNPDSHIHGYRTAAKEYDASREKDEKNEKYEASLTDKEHYILDSLNSLDETRRKQLISFINEN